jgi:hypothetical protein
MLIIAKLVMAVTFDYTSIQSWLLVTRVRILLIGRIILFFTISQKICWIQKTIQKVISNRHLKGRLGPTATINGGCYSDPRADTVAVPAAVSNGCRDNLSSKNHNMNLDGGC